MKNLKAYMTPDDSPVLVLLTFQAPPELAERFREALKVDGVSMRSVLEASVRRYLDERPKKRSKSA